MEKSPQDLKKHMIDELTLWYSATIVRLMDQKNHLEEISRTHQIHFNHQNITELQSFLETQFQTVMFAIEKLKNTWKCEDDSHVKLAPNVADQINTLKKCDIKQVLINDKQVYPIPTYLDLSNLKFIKLSFLTESALKVLTHCPKLQNIAIGGGDKSSNIDDIMISKIVTKLPQLKIISLWDTTISDHGVQKLKGMKNLESLVIQSENLTPEGRKRAQSAFKQISTIFSIKK